MCSDDSYKECRVTVSILLLGMLTSCLQAEEESINGVPLSGIVASLKNKEFRNQRLDALPTIALWAKSPKEHLPVYLEALRDPDEVVRATAAQTLGFLGERLPS